LIAIGLSPSPLDYAFRARLHHSPFAILSPFFRHSGEPPGHRLRL